MKRIYTVISFLLMGCLLAGLCSCEKKKRITLSSLVITVIPSTKTLFPGQNQQYTASAMRNGNQVSDVDFTWSLVPNTLGDITSTGFFTAGSTEGLSGNVIASAEGESGSASVSVGYTATYYGLFSDTFTNPSVKFDINNPPDIDGGYLGFWGSISSSDDTIDYMEPPKSTTFSIASGWAGIWIQFGCDRSFLPDSGGPAVEKNMASFSNASLNFDIKTSTEVIVSVEWTDEISAGKDSAAKKVNNDIGIALDNNWHSVSINLSTLTGEIYGRPINFNKIKLPFAFSADGGTSGVSIGIDQIRWEK